MSFSFSFCQKADPKCPSYSFGKCQSLPPCMYKQTIFDATTAGNMMVILAHMAKIMQTQDKIKQRLDQLEDQQKHR